MKRFIAFFYRKSPSLILVCIISGLFGCQSLRYSVTNGDISKELRKSEIFSNQFTGFTLYDPEGERYLCNYNDELYFTPASNTKILTTLACLENLGDSIATFTFQESNDSIFISPLADPTFLHPDFLFQKPFDYLKGKKVSVNMPKVKINKFGSGWAWDDFNYNFQKELALFPIYGNAVHLSKERDSIVVTPDFFQNYTQSIVGKEGRNKYSRSEFLNVFKVELASDSSSQNIEVPFIYSEELLTQLLEDTLSITPDFIAEDNLYPDTLYSQSKFHAISMMMLPSDNFLAEQLLIHCALINGFQNIDQYRAHLLAEWSSFLPHKVKWVDASGLSRYNLITPRSNVSVLNRIYENQSWQTIMNIFPIGGVSGTIKKWYASETPYIIAKTGTLSNNHNLSGYIKTKSGRTLIFSLMNNHYLGSSSTIKQEMEKFLLNIREAY
ncbi:MAG: D-alanyl-D-alanine carboxypeptidase [Cyclobacteriaceae bacterium]